MPGGVREEGGGEETESDGYCAFDEEDEGPALVFAGLNLRETSGEKSSECARKGGCAVEVRNAAEHLFAWIDFTDVVD